MAWLSMALYLLGALAVYGWVTEQGMVAAQSRIHGWQLVAVVVLWPLFVLLTAAAAGAGLIWRALP